MPMGGSPLGVQLEPLPAPPATSLPPPPALLPQHHHLSSHTQPPMPSRYLELFMVNWWMDWSLDRRGKGVLIDFKSILITWSNLISQYGFGSILITIKMKWSQKWSQSRWICVNYDHSRGGFVSTLISQDGFVSTLTSQYGLASILITIKVGLEQVWSQSRWIWVNFDL